VAGYRSAGKQRRERTSERAASIRCWGKDVCRGQGCLRGRHAVAAQWACEGVVFRCLKRGPKRPQAHMRNGRAHVPAGTSRPATTGRNSESGYLSSWSRAHRRLVHTVVDRQAVADNALGSKSVPAFHIACITTANLRASATAARLKPRRARSAKPQRRKALSARMRVSRMVAAS
jgi:hypothetical protein